MQNHVPGAPPIESWQELFVKNVGDLIATNYFSRRPAIRVLDAGCDLSGHQLWHLASLISGDIVGVNIYRGFPSREALQCLQDRPNASLTRMDAVSLRYPDETFDMVISANLMEHIPDPARYIQECGRVLKKTGIAYFETYPVWTGPRGHHVMKSIIHAYASPEEPFEDDGTIIPDWSHLKYTESQMRSCLQTRLTPKALEYVLHFMYHSSELNRTGWRDIHRAFKKVFPIIDLRAGTAQGVDATQMPQDNRDDYDVAGFQLAARKAPQPPALRLLLRLAVRCRRRKRLLGLAISRRIRLLSGRHSPDG
jgi:SAM-dependent methyltransferase